MRAAVTRAAGSITIEEIDKPTPGPGEVLVRMSATGLCRSDLTVLDGHGLGPAPPAVLGHEGAGVVEALGAGTAGIEIGDHVVCSIVLSCGQCFQCRSGSLTLCEVGTRAAFGGGMMDGTSRLTKGGEPINQFFCQSSFADYAVVPCRSVVPIPADVPFDVAAVLGCGAMTGIGAVIRRARVVPMSSVVVLGTGGVGLSAVMAARAAGASMIIAVDTSPDALELALTVGATHALSGPGLVEQVIELTRRGADYVIDTVGTSATLETSLTATRAGGDVVLVGLADAAAKASLTMFELCLQKRVTGTYAGSVHPQLDIPGALAWYRDGRLPLDRLVTTRLALDELPSAIDDLRRGGTCGRSVVIFPA